MPIKPDWTRREILKTAAGGIVLASSTEPRSRRRAGPDRPRANPP